MKPEHLFKINVVNSLRLTTIVTHYTIGNKTNNIKYINYYIWNFDDGSVSPEKPDRKGKPPRFRNIPLMKEENIELLK